MIFKKLFKKTRRGNGSNGGSSGKTGKDIEHTAFLQISSAIKSQKDISAVLEVIGREAARCLRAHRSIVFLVDGAKGVLKTQFTYFLDPVDDKQGFVEEKEIARRAIVEKRPFLLKAPRDFSEFFKNESRERKIISLLGVPFGLQGKIIGALNLSLVNGTRAFNEKDLLFLSILANHASIALNNQYLADELRKAASFRKNYEHYLDNLETQIQSLSAEERKRIDEHIGKFLSGLKTETQPGRKPIEEYVATGNGLIKLAGEMRFEDSPEPLTEKVQVEIEGLSGGPGFDLGRAGIFIPTANPRDLGEQFLLRLYLTDGHPVEAPCKVIFSNKYGKESQNLRRGMGIKFLDPTPEIQKQLEEYVQTRRQQGPAAETEPEDPESPGPLPPSDDQKEGLESFRP